PPACNVRHQPGFWSGQIPDHSADESVANIKIASADPVRFAEKQRHSHRIDIGVAGDRCGAGVFAVSKSVGQLALQAVAHFALPLRLEAVIRRFTIKQYRTNPGSAGRSRRDSAVRSAPVGIELVSV